MSKTLPSSAVELEIGKYVSSQQKYNHLRRRLIAPFIFCLNNQAKTKSKGGNEFNAAIVLSFSDFLKLLEIFATKVPLLPIAVTHTPNLIAVTGVPERFSG